MFTSIEMDEAILRVKEAFRLYVEEYELAKEAGRLDAPSSETSTTDSSEDQDNID